MSPSRSVLPPVLVWMGWLLALLSGVVMAGAALLVVASWWGMTFTP